MPRFHGEVVLITGASSGIGAALAVEMARRGADVALVGRRLDRLEEVAARVRAAGRTAVVIRGDVTRDDDMRMAVETTLAALARLDIVVANAGFGVAGRFERLGLDDYRRQFETNVFGVLRIVQASLPAITAAHGRVVLVGSMLGHVSPPALSAYSMSKFAVRALADALREELRPAGVAVTLISPGIVASELRSVDNQGVFHPERADPAPPWLVMPANVAARRIADAIACRRAEAVVTLHGKLVVWLGRHLPRMSRVLVRLVSRRRRR